MNHEFLDEKCLLGEFYGDSHRHCNFNRVVRMLISKGQGCLDNENLANTQKYFDRLLLYIEAVKADSEIRTQELAEIPYKEFIRSDEKRELDYILEIYLSRISRR